MRSPTLLPEHIQRGQSLHLDSLESRQFMLALVRSALHQMKLNENKKGGPQEGAHQEICL